MKNLSKVLPLLIIYCLLFTSGVKAQESYKMASNPEFIVAGTSTIHDWTMNATEGSGKAKILINEGDIIKIQSLVVNMPVKSLKSGKSQMDKNAYEALNEAQHPLIKFELTKVKEIKNGIITAMGNLTIAGNTRPATLKVNYKVNETSVLFSGGFDITFSGFDLKAPTAVLGTIKTGDALQLSFKTQFTKQDLL